MQRLSAKVGAIIPHGSSAQPPLSIASSDLSSNEALSPEEAILILDAVADHLEGRAAACKKWETAASLRDSAEHLRDRARKRAVNLESSSE